MFLSIKDDHVTVMPTFPKHTYQTLTYELDGLEEPAADVFFVVVLHRDALVLVSALEVVGTVGRHVQQGGDSHAVQDLLLGSVKGAAEVEERQDLDWATLETATNWGDFFY